MNKFVVVIGLICAVGCAMCMADAVNKHKCKIVVQEATGENYTYDLTDLGVLSVSYHTESFKLDLCEGADTGCAAGTAVCRNPRLGNKTNAGYTSLGKLSTRSVLPYGYQPPQPGIGIVNLFGDGDACGDSDTYSSSVIIICDPDETAMIAVTAAEDCYYEFSISSKYGCGTLTTSSEDDSDESGASGGDTAALVILIILLVAVVLYFGIGVIYQKKTADPGTLKEYIIHNEFWCSLPSLVVDGVKFIFHGCKKGDYLNV